MSLFECNNIEDYNKIPVNTHSLFIRFTPDNGILPEGKLPIGLTYLFCDGNKLEELPALPDSITLLNCEFNNIKSLPELPETLKSLRCFNNQLKKLPKLPESLESLWCSNNKIIFLPELPKSIDTLLCSSNQLTFLPELPETLESLICSDNQLRYLPKLPESLKQLNCYNNNFFEPFRTYINEYERTGDINRLRKSIDKYYDRLEEKLVGLQELNNNEALKRMRGEPSINRDTMALIGEKLGAKSGFSVSKQLDNIRRMSRGKRIYHANIPTPNISNTEFSRRLTNIEQGHLNKNTRRVKLKFNKAEIRRLATRNNRTRTNASRNNITRTTANRTHKSK
jgi:hypothetical protein